MGGRRKGETDRGDPGPTVEDLAPRIVLLREADMWCPYTTALDDRIRLIRETAIKAYHSMVGAMMGNARGNLKILRPVVGLVSVEMVNNFASPETSAQRLPRYDSVLIDIVLTAGGGMIGEKDADIAIGCNEAPTSPVGIPFSITSLDCTGATGQCALRLALSAFGAGFSPCCHDLSVAQGLLRSKRENAL